MLIIKIIKSIILGSLFYCSALAILSNVFNTGDVVGLCNGLFFSSVLFYMILDKKSTKDDYNFSIYPDEYKSKEKKHDPNQD
ncbi:MAG: hypothetical protein ACRC6T_12670 [Sarcina sp.]